MTEIPPCHDWREEDFPGLGSAFCWVCQNPAATGQIFLWNGFCPTCGCQLSGDGTQHHAIRVHPGILIVKTEIIKKLCEEVAGSLNCSQCPLNNDCPPASGWTTCKDAMFAYFGIKDDGGGKP